MQTMVYVDRAFDGRKLILSPYYFEHCHVLVYSN